MDTHLAQRRPVNLSKVERSLLWTLYQRVLDFRDPDPLLGDVWAVDTFDRLEVDLRDLRGASVDRYLTLLRARKIDSWVREWNARNPEGTVVHMGCGLDSRALRVGAPRRGHWFDVDLPAVVELRRGLLPEPDRYQLVPGSLADADWLARLPADTPVLAVAESVAEFVRVDDLRRFLEHVTSQATAGGEIVFDIVSSWAGRLALTFRWELHTMEDSLLPERWCPGVRLVQEYEVAGDHALLPEGPHRDIYRALSRWPSTRSVMRVLRYTF